MDIQRQLEHFEYEMNRTLFGKIWNFAIPLILNLYIFWKINKEKLVSGNTGESVREQENKWTDLALHQFNESNTAGSNN